MVGYAALHPPCIFGDHAHILATAINCTVLVVLVPKLRLGNPVSESLPQQAGACKTCVPKQELGNELKSSDYDGGKYTLK